MNYIWYNVLCVYIYIYMCQTNWMKSMEKPPSPIKWISTHLLPITSNQAASGLSAVFWAAESVEKKGAGHIQVPKPSRFAMNWSMKKVEALPETNIFAPENGWLEY